MDPARKPVSLGVEVLYACVAALQNGADLL